MKTEEYLHTITQSLITSGCIFESFEPTEFELHMRGIELDPGSACIQTLFTDLESALQHSIGNSLSLPRVNNSAKIVAATRRFSKKASEKNKLEIIIFLLYLLNKSITGNQLILEIIKVVSSILLSREEDFVVMKELSGSAGLPVISDTNFIYITNEPVPLSVLASDSTVIIHNKIDTARVVYRFYSFPGYCLVSQFTKAMAAGKNRNRLSVMRETEVTSFLLSCKLPAHTPEGLKSFGIDKNYLVYNGNDSEPTVVLDALKNRLTIKGASLPLNAFEFYQPVIRWISMQQKTGTALLTLEFDLDFFDTQSAKMLLEIMRKAVQLKSQGISIQFNWFYLADDQEIYEAGQDYSAIVMQEFIFHKKETIEHVLLK